MGFFDAVLSLFSGGGDDAPPTPPSPEVQAKARAAWSAASASGDYMAAQSAAYELAEQWLWDESVAAYRSLHERFPEQRGRVATMIGQTLYLGKAGYKARLDDAAKAAVYVDALEWYLRAVADGDRSQDLNYVEMLEWLATQPAQKATVQKYAATFLQQFPSSEYLSRVKALR